MPNPHTPRRRSRRPALVSALLTVGLAAGTLVAVAPAAHALTPSAGWAELEGRIDAIVDEAAADGVTLGVSAEDLSGLYGAGTIDAGSQEPVKAASVIKLPLLALLMDEADHGRLSLDESVTIPAGSSNIVGGAGTLQGRQFPLDITVRELMELMVQVSDNTATNVLIDRAGGFDRINAYIEGLGYDTLWLGRKMIHTATPPLGENWINAAEVTDLIARLYRHDILSASSSEHIIGLMKGQLVNTKFGAVIPREHLANKTGELGDVSHDSGIILLDGHEVALTVTSSYAAGRSQTEVNRYVQRVASTVYGFLQEPVEEEIPAPTIGVSDEWPELSDAIQPVIDEARAAGVDVGVAVRDLSGSYDDRALFLGKLDRYTTASTIKLALAATVMTQVQSGELDLDDVATITEDERYGGSGVLKDRAFPQDVTVGEMLDLMVTVSDNTATNKLADVVGGVDRISDVIAAAGISAGDLHFGRKMFGPVVPSWGDVWLTPVGMDQLLTSFYRIAESDDEAATPSARSAQDYLTPESARTIIGLMLDQQVKTKLGASIPAEVLAHKTGENDTVSHDVGLLLVPGQELTLSVFTTAGEGFSGDLQATANPYVQRIGAIVYEYVLATTPDDGSETPGATPTPTPEPTSGATETPAPTADADSTTGPAAAGGGSDGTLADTGAQGTGALLGVLAVLVLAGTAGLIGARHRRSRG
ncbi:serine hydrolase [Mycetocola reblochoni]|uniref:Beta-lactamase n=2 Tax=Mycetocola reblochoni TaxID=331618 RepID=A0A1R4JKZ6_9MICO|nr:serine hydrolase [Mycetocola reblochoni]RLP69209.1 hypothetical protein D9V30_07800 [Mycetocola reblochoni]SJN32475.1 Beta-lactamase [Mycetocola reblochoni REB411]